MKKRYYILIGVVSYLFFTLSNMPAAKILNLAEKNTQLPATFLGVHGSLWEGGAEKVLLKDAPPIDNLKWSFNPLSLLIAHMNGELKGSIKNQNVIGNISIGPTGNISASDIRSRIDASVMQELIQMPLGELDGTFIINIMSLNLVQDALPVINANIKWQSAKLTLAETVDLGHIQLHIKPDNSDNLLADISNKNGQITLQGDARIDQTKAYNITLHMTPESNATDNIRQSLKMFARRQTNGSYLLKRKGNLNEFGI